MFPVQHLVYSVNIKDVWHMSDLVLISCKVNVQLVVVIVADYFKCCIIDRFLFHHCSHHVRVNELVYFFYRYIHAMISRDVSF